jgi:HlyD family secretion protein
MRNLLVVLLVASISLAGCGERGANVDVEKVSKRDIVETVSASGKIQPELEVKITSEVSGQIIELPVKEGDFVEEGDVLLLINPDIYQSAQNRADAALNTARSNLANAKARLAQAEAQFVNAEQSFNRSKNLYDEGAISLSDWESAIAAHEVAEAEVTAGEQSVSAAQFSIASAQATKTEASDNLKRTRILAPKSGIVTALTKEAGEGVLGNNMMQGEVIMNVSDLSTMEVNVEVNESDIVRVALGDTALVEVDAFLDEEFKGIVTEIGNTALNSLNGMSLSVDQVTNFSVKVRILESSYGHLMADTLRTSPFRPGMSATVEIITDQMDDVLSIPIAAVTTRTDTTSSNIVEEFKRKKDAEKQGEDLEPMECVFVLGADGNAKIRLVKTGIQDNRFIHITEGLDEDDDVITGPYDQVSRILRSGDPVNAESEEKEEEDAEGS